MIGHEAISVAQPIIALVNVLKDVEEILAAPIVFEDGFLFVAARGNVIYGAGVFYAKRTSHGANVS